MFYRLASLMSSTAMRIRFRKNMTRMRTTRRTIAQKIPVERHTNTVAHVFNGAGCSCIGVLTEREPSVGEVEVVVEVGRELGSSARLRNIAQVDVFVSTVRSSCDQHELMFMINV